MKLRSGAQIAPIASGGIAQNPNMFQAIAQNNASSPFLKLPQEIKNRIYHFVCGGHMVHILHNDSENHHVHGGDNFELSHTICNELISEKQLQKEFDLADPATVSWNVAGIAGRHEVCLQPQLKHTKAPKHKKGPKPNQLSLTHLRSCRQIYFEARKVHYTNNTFAIGCNDILEYFAGARSRHKQQLDIRSLYLDIGITHAYDIQLWSDSIIKAILRRFKSVRFLYLNLSQFYCGCSIDSCGYEGSEMTERQAKMFEKLAILPLKEATLLVDDSPLGALLENDEMGLRWTVRQKQEFSKKVRDVLLRRGAKQIKADRAGNSKEL